jgi:hypothetical protein
MRLSIKILSVFVLLSHIASAQFEGQVYQSSTAAKVFTNSIERTIAWSGGFNNPQMAMADLNNDGKKDLVIYERYNQQVKTFINQGTNGNPDYRYNPFYSLFFPAVSEYLILADYNNDGIADLFHRGLTGMEVYKGYYDNNHLTFSYYKALYYNNDQQSTGEVNAYVDPADIPAIYDVDGDGDLDFIGFYAGGARLYYYRNMRIEEGLPADTIKIKLRDRCWGKVYQDIQRAYDLANSCDNSGLLRSSGSDRHTGNTLCMFDADGDGDGDILNGNLSFSDIQLLVNGKAQSTNGIDSIISQDTTWKGYSTPSWPSAFNLDIDQDSKNDILITPHGEFTSDNYKTISLYKNTGTVNAPVFTFQSDTFLVDKTIDVGSASRPLFYDYDKDGKPDLLVGSEGYFQNGTLKSRLSYYRNTSTVGNPSFDFQTDDLANFSALGLRGSSPAVGDLDGDGNDDLVLGQQNGMLTMYTNLAGSNTVTPIWSNPVTSIKDENLVTIDIGSGAAPVIYDIDQDDRPDLLIGTMLGYLVYYRNVTTVPGQMKLQKVNAQLGGIKVDPDVSFIGYCTPFIGKMDNTGIEYIMSGSESGRIYRFTGFQGGDTTLQYPMIDSNYSFISGVGVRTAPAIADIDGDGMYEMAIGNQFGGLFLYKQWVNASVNNTIANTTLDVTVYPNPAKNYIDINLNTPVANADIALLNTTGQKVRVQSMKGNKTSRLDITGLPSGIYFCIVSSGTLRHTQTVSIIK